MKNRKNVRPSIEVLETRDLLATYLWVANNGFADVSSYTVGGVQPGALPGADDEVVINENSPEADLCVNQNWTLGRINVGGGNRSLMINPNLTLTLDPAPGATFVNQCAVIGALKMGNGSKLVVNDKDSVLHSTSNWLGLTDGVDAGSIFMSNGGTINLSSWLPSTTCSFFVGYDTAMTQSAGTMNVGYGGSASSNLTLHGGADVTVSTYGSLMFLAGSTGVGAQGGVAVAGVGGVSEVINNGYMLVSTQQIADSHWMRFDAKLTVGSTGTTDFQAQTSSVPAPLVIFGSTAAVVTVDGDVNLYGNTDIRVFDKVLVNSGGELNVYNNWNSYAQIRQTDQADVWVLDIFGTLHLDGRLRVSSTVSAGYGYVALESNSTMSVMINTTHASGLGVSGNCWFGSSVTLIVEDGWSSGTPGNYGLIVCYDGGVLSGAADFYTTSFYGFWNWSWWGPVGTNSWVLYA